jgi:hypothetical protein
VLFITVISINERICECSLCMLDDLARLYVRFVLMQRSPLQIVSLAVLVPTAPRNCDGWASLPQEQSSAADVAQVLVRPDYIQMTGGLGTVMRHWPVRVIADADVIKNGGLNPEWKERLLANEWNFICGVNLLFRAEEVGDSTVAKEAYELLSPLLFGRAMTASASKAINLAISVLTIKENIGLDLEELISHALKNVRLVCWQRWPDKRTIRAKRAVGLYCPDHMTAIAAKMILGNIRVCLRCHAAFIAKRPKQNCCCVQCREAHRLARWRARKKAEFQRKEKAVKVRSRKTQMHNTRRLR